MANPLKDIGDIPVDEENEAIIVINAIKNKTNREIFLRRIDYRQFRTPEFQTLSWAVIACAEAGMEMNHDALLLKSKLCPVRKIVDYKFIDGIINNFAEVPEQNFNEHIEKLVLDNVKSEVMDLVFKSLYKSLLDPTQPLSAVEERVNAINSVIGKGYSTYQLEFQTMEEVTADYIELRDKMQGKRTTGFRQLDDKLTEGLQEGQITIICGLPGMGKSSFALSLMKNLSNRGIYTAQFALEMPNRSLMNKLIAFNTNIAVTRVTAHWDKFTDEEKKVYEWELERIRNNPYILLNDKPTQTLATINEQTMLLQDKLKTQYIVLVIDLYGKISDLLQSDNFARSYEQNLNITQTMTRKLGVHTIPVAQINREVTKRKFSRPRMSDLKNAGAWEEVADIILGIHRPYYNPEKALKRELAYGEAEVDPNVNLAEIIFLKQRMGLGNKIVNFFFDPNTTRLSPIDSEYQDMIDMAKIEVEGNSFQ